MSNHIGLGRGPKNRGTLGPRRLVWGVSDPLETRPSPTRVTARNFVALSQTIWA